MNLAEQLKKPEHERDDWAKKKVVKEMRGIDMVVCETCLKMRRPAEIGVTTADERKRAGVAATACTTDRMGWAGKSKTIKDTAPAPVDEMLGLRDQLAQITLAVARLESVLSGGGVGVNLSAGKSSGNPPVARESGG